jgi:HEAT repeat protein
MRARLLLVAALGRVGDPEAPAALASALGREPAYPFAIRRELAVALGRRPEPAATSALSGTLGGDADARLRFAAAQGLAGRADAIPALGASMRPDASEDVRREAVRSVGLAGGEAALALLAGVAGDDTTDFAVRESAIQELGRSFAERALGPLEALLASPDERVRAGAIGAIARVPGDIALALVRGVADGDPSPTVRGRARRAIAQARR